MLNLLLAGSVTFTDRELKEIEDFGYNITAIQREDNLEIQNIETYDVVVCNWLFAHYDIKNFQRIKAIQLLSAGFDRLPMDYVKEHNIQVRNAKGIYSIPIAEFTVMTILDAYKYSDYFYNNQKLCIWNKNRNLDELSDKTVCICGTGSVGTEVAKKLSVFVERVIGIDLHPREKPYFTKIVGLDKMHDILAQSDIVVLTLPLTKETYHMFDQELFDGMREDSILVNVARGALIEENALKQALDTGKFRAVILDVFEKEPLNENFWGWKAERVRIIPHNTFESKKNKERLKKQILDNLRDWADKIPIEHGKKYDL